MKTTLAYDKANRQFTVYVGKPQRKFYLGDDATLAQQRKLKLVEHYRACKAEGRWNEHGIAAGKTIAKGGTVIALEIPTLDVQRQHVAFAKKAEDRITELEAMIRKHMGDGAIEGPKVSVHTALDSYHDYRKQTEINPDTGKPTEHALSEGNYCRMLKRFVDDMPLSRLDYIQLNRWCKTVAARPLSKKTGTPIKQNTVRNALKTIRLFVKWCSRNYGWRRPEEWHEATLVTTRRTSEERIEAKAQIGRFYSPTDIGTIWKYAKGVERLLILLGLNFGYAQAEILNMIPADIAGETTVAIRAKSEVVGKWAVWSETRSLGNFFDKLPATRQGIANVWNKLLTRVEKTDPTFRRLSFKWLRKSGSTWIRKIAGSEISSLYLSHGESAGTADKLLDVYADTDWDVVVDAVNKMRDTLLPHIQAEPMQGKPHVVISVIEQIQNGWREGLTYKDIIAKVGVSRDTVYRYRPPVG